MLFRKTVFAFCVTPIILIRKLPIVKLNFNQINNFYFFHISFEKYLNRVTVMATKQKLRVKTFSVY